MSAATTVQQALAWLEGKGTKKNLEDLKRYGIAAPRAFGVGVGEIKKYSVQIGRDHELAQELWETGWYEARLLSSFVGEPAKLTLKQMNAWADEFDNWGVVDTVCFHLFDRSPLVWKVIPAWAKAEPEFRKRAAFALLWSLTVHDKAASDKPFVDGLKLIESGAVDERHFVSKAVNMALRAIGKRNAALHEAAIETAARLAARPAAAPRWVGSHALRELQGASVARRLLSAKTKRASQSD